jgi:hypothetical protein
MRLTTIGCGKRVIAPLSNIASKKNKRTRLSSS